MLLGLHYEDIMDALGYRPVPVVCGVNKLGKTKSAVAALSLIGNGQSFYSSVKERFIPRLCSRSTIPPVLDDLKKAKTIEEIAVAFYNRGKDGTCLLETTPRTCPMLTVNWEVVDALGKDPRWSYVMDIVILCNTCHLLFYYVFAILIFVIECTILMTCMWWNELWFMRNVMLTNFGPWWKGLNWFPFLVASQKETFCAFHCRIFGRLVLIPLLKGRRSPNGTAEQQQAEARHLEVLETASKAVGSLIGISEQIEHLFHNCSKEVVSTLLKGIPWLDDRCLKNYAVLINLAEKVIMLARIPTIKCQVEPQPSTSFLYNVHVIKECRSCKTTIQQNDIYIDFLIFSCCKTHHSLSELWI